MDRILNKIFKIPKKTKQTKRKRKKKFSPKNKEDFDTKIKNNIL